MAELARWFETRRSPFEMLEKLIEGEPGLTGIRVEEVMDGDTMVVRAELPGIDPEKDVDVSVTGQMLEIRAQRREQTEQKEKDSYRSEFRYGSFARRVPLPEGVKEEDITASYKDGVLEVRTPVPDKQVASSKQKIQITRG